jgi:hypothetical protein
MYELLLLIWLRFCYVRRYVLLFQRATQHCGAAHGPSAAANHTRSNSSSKKLQSSLQD